MRFQIEEQNVQIVSENVSYFVCPIVQIDHFCLYTLVI